MSVPAWLVTSANLAASAAHLATCLAVHRRVRQLQAVGGPGPGGPPAWSMLLVLGFWASGCLMHGMAAAALPEWGRAVLVLRLLVLPAWPAAWWALGGWSVRLLRREADLRRAAESALAPLRSVPQGDTPPDGVFVRPERLALRRAAAELEAVLRLVDSGVGGGDR